MVIQAPVSRIRDPSSAVLCGLLLLATLLYVAFASSAVAPRATVPVAATIDPLRYDDCVNIEDEDYRSWCSAWVSATVAYSTASSFSDPALLAADECGVSHAACPTSCAEGKERYGRKADA